MQEFTYHRASTVEEACERLAADENAAVLAGGQTLLLELRAGDADVDRVVDVGSLDDLDRIAVTPEHVCVGATATYARVRSHDRVRSVLPALPRMVSHVGDEQIRSRATLVGGVLCASPTGHPPPLAVGLDARLTVRSRSGERTVAAADLYERPGETTLADDELVTEVRFPRPDEGTAVAFETVSGPQGVDAIVNLAAAVRTDAGRIANATFVVGGVTPTPSRLRDVERRLAGERISDDLRTEAVATAVDAVDVTLERTWDDGYRRSLVGETVGRVLDRVDGGAGRADREVGA